METENNPRLKGLVLVNTGSGKGKTTAALGTALRAFGNGQKVLIFQFIKGSWKYGELEAIRRLGEGIEIRQMGDGFVRYNQDATEKTIAIHKKKAETAWQQLQEEVQSDRWDLIVLDEINYAIYFGLLDSNKVVELIEHRPQRLNLILTGRYAPQEIIERADTVTEMTLVKHAFQKGIRARCGIEY